MFQIWNRRKSSIPQGPSREPTRDKPLDTSKPGKPFVCGKLLVDEVCLAWDRPSSIQFEEPSYQIRYKECEGDAKGTKWRFYQEQTTSCAIIFTNLKSETKYIFQVRMVNDEEEGPWSDISEPVETIQSAAHHLLRSMRDVKRDDTTMCCKRVPATEDGKARNGKAKTRKLVIGKVPKQQEKEKTIMLVGGTGSGKSTLVDGMINFILGISWNDPYRLTLVDLEEDEKRNVGNQAVSQTQWITCYKLHHIYGSRLSYTLNIIDTPGFGDTRGIEQDKKIIEQIRELFSRNDEMGVLYIDAICFIVKSPDARLGPSQKYIFDSILSLFGQDIKDNFCILITFADGKNPPVLSALREANLPHELYHPFNNSGLFAENFGQNTEISSIYWDMGCKSFKAFFDKLSRLKTKSLTQTRHVLEQRKVVENTMDNLLPALDAGLDKVEELKQEIVILEKHKADIEYNSEFTYTVEETQHRQIDLPKGKHTTNCLNCHTTCHKDCALPNDEDKRQCMAIDSNGYCTECYGRCFWSIHRNTPYLFEYVKVKVQKTYTEKLLKYRIASGEKISREIVVQRMQKEVNEMEKNIFHLMQKINTCNNILRQIALKPDPLSLVEHIDLMIESERLEKRPGFLARIESLKVCRKRATIGKDVDHFFQESNSVAPQPKTGSKFLSFFGFRS